MFFSFGTFVYSPLQKKRYLNIIISTLFLQLHMYIFSMSKKYFFFYCKIENFYHIIYLYIFFCIFLHFFYSPLQKKIIEYINFNPLSATTVCQKSLIHFYIASCCREMDNTSLKYCIYIISPIDFFSSCNVKVKMPFFKLSLQRQNFPFKQPAQYIGFFDRGNYFLLKKNS